MTEEIKQQLQDDVELDTNVRLGRLIKSILALRGMTSKQLADMTGMSTQTISYIINGKTDARLSTIHTIEEVLDCKLLIVPKEYIL